MRFFNKSIMNPPFIKKTTKKPPFFCIFNDLTIQILPGGSYILYCNYIIADAACQSANRKLPLVNPTDIC